jgi:transcriptional regulator of acetoin/glycerol metabolism
MDTDHAAASSVEPRPQSGAVAPTAAAMRGEITASRARSSAFGLHCDRCAPPYRSVAGAGDRLAQLAGPVLDRVGADLCDSPLGVVLVDRDARIVDRRVGARSLRSTLDRARLACGHEWSERSAGTNALGTALEWSAPIIVRGPEHFSDALAAVTLAAAPIVDPRTGQLAGAVGIACAFDDTSALMLPYACHVAREIEGLLIDDAAAAERALLEHFVRTRRGARGAIVSVNQRAMFTNAAAACFVDDADHARLWEWADRMIERRPPRCEELHLTAGTRVTAQCEPVRFGSKTVGALIRLVIGAPATREGAPRVSRRPHVGWGSLSAAQLGVAELVATGLTNREAATRLYVSPHTVDFHLRQIFNKLGISSRVELARIATERRADRRRDHESAA